MTRPIRIFYAAGPGDLIGTYGHWKAGRDDPSQVAITYSSQFYDLCRELGAEGYAVSYCPRKDKVHEGNLKLLHRRIPFMKGPGPLYHISIIPHLVWLVKLFRQKIFNKKIRTEVLIFSNFYSHSLAKSKEGESL